MADEVVDRYGHRIYLTDERWEHITFEHLEMVGYRTQLLETLRRGRRKQESRDPSRYRYVAGFRNLHHGCNSIVAVVKFSISDDGSPNNFILTAYQKFIHSLAR